MSEELTFRYILGAYLVLVAPIGMYFRLRSQATGERLDRRQEGLFILVALRLTGAVCAASLLTWLFRPRLLDWAAYDAGAALRWAGVVLLPVAGAMIVWTFATLGRNLTDTVVTRKEHTLVTGGPYRWVRHPFYLSGLLMLTAVSLIVANWLVPLLGSIAMALLMLRTKKEEQLLIERFGADYQTYMLRTGQFFPRLAIGRRGGT